MNLGIIAEQLNATTGALRAIGFPFETVLVVLSGLLAACALVPAFASYRRAALLGMTGVLLAGEAVLIWFHVRLWQLAVVIDPASGKVVSHIYVPLWIESEKLYIWALIVAVMGALMVRQRDELLPGTMLAVAVLSAGAALLGHPFIYPLPSLLSQYAQFLQAISSGVPQAAQGAFMGLDSAARYFYNTPYMWVHPPLLFFSYGAFTLSFVAVIEMIRRKHSSYETTAYRWARLGYLALTVGMLLGFPWAIAAWKGESWWWSGKVNMSIMMWVLYTAYLHARLYLRRKGMWRVVAFVAVMSFVILVLTYVATYVVPGAHSYA